MHRILATLLLFAAAHAAQGKNKNELEDFQNQYMMCQQMTDDIGRLRCYDDLAIAPEALDPNRKRRVDELDDLARRERSGMLQSDDPNYFVYTNPIDDNIDDEHHAEFYLSIRYPLAERKFHDWQDDAKSLDTGVGRFLNAAIPDRLYLHYNGLYDFYALDSDRYDSAPVISRRQNPGISVEYDFAHGKDTLRLGWFHESNGQQMEADEIDRLDQLWSLHGEDHALAEVSRGWDYALLRWQSNSQMFVDTLEDTWLKYNVEMRYFCDCQGFGFQDGREDDIWWEPGNNVQISDFDGLRGMVEGSLWKNRRGNLAFDARLELKTGLYHSPGQYLSGKFSLGARFNNLRTTLFYFDGYGKDLSTYHLRSKYVGFGLELR
ncbi:MAG: hypothetical protein GWP63_06750 [Haliea sp.]|jgi:hypothetical protein|nr:hypothetical protein [Haliea sp.]